MELLLILIYVSICYVIFKIFRIPVNQWSLATAALGGIIGITLLQAAFTVSRWTRTSQTETATYTSSWLRT